MVELEKGYTRVDIIQGSYYLEERPDGSVFASYISEMDFKGNIPKKIITVAGVKTQLNA